MGHRGPDDCGVDRLTPDLIFGHKRLSIQDLSISGHQPMHTLCERYSIIFNGEIYNFKELRNTLQKKDTSFRLILILK